MKGGFTFAEYIAHRKAQGDDIRDLGHNHYYSLIVEQGRTEGAAVLHMTPGGQTCGAALFWDATRVGADRAKWALHSLDPLDVSPSLLCLQCGDHGFIRGGKWIPA